MGEESIIYVAYNKENIFDVKRVGDGNIVLRDDELALPKKEYVRMIKDEVRVIINGLTKVELLKRK